MDSETKIEGFSYLWDASSSWALLNINSDEPEQEPKYIIVDTATSQALLISDNNLYRNVKKMMLEKGVKIISSLSLE
jgi:hypothetical protein